MLETVPVTPVGVICVLAPSVAPTSKTSVSATILCPEFVLKLN